MGLRRREKGDGSWELEKGDGDGNRDADGNANGRKEKNDKIGQSKENPIKMAGQEIVKEHFSSSRSLQNEPKNSPYREF